MKNFIYNLIILLLVINYSMANSVEKLPRFLIGLYDGTSFEDSSKSHLCKYAEKPLNHLGIVIKYYDIHKGLPDLSDSGDVIGVITWFIHGQKSIDPNKCLEWSKKAVELGLKYVLIGEGIFQLNPDTLLPVDSVNSFWKMLGMKEGGWISDNYLTTVIDLDPSMMNFERDSRYMLHPYKVMLPISNSVTVHAKARYKNDQSLDTGLIMTSEKGAYINENYVLFSHISDITGVNNYWNANPFELFRKIFDTDTLPKPDITTEAGRRIYYSHIDGDGWNNGPQLTRYKTNKPKISADTVYREILSPFPDMPCSCGAIGADLSEDWVGTKESRRIARLIYALPQVEVASHTLSHPFHWYFYEDYLPQDEIAFLKHYVNDGWAGNQRYEDLYEKATQNIRDKELAEGYDTPRAFAHHPFELEAEIQESLDIVNANSPEGKDVKIYLWSGDCVPFENAIKATHNAKIKNMNGGDTRFDFIYSSYAWVAPVGRWVNKQLQVFCSGSNENTYTNLWHEKFWAFSNVPLTYINSELPIRLIPMNLYYHIYCAENEPALSSLIENVRYASRQEICPLFASTYAEIAEGFYSTEIYSMGSQKWAINNRGRLNTIRFDKATLLSADFENSEGVIGQKHYQGSLYIYLDRSKEKAIISLKTSYITEKEPVAKRAYLISSRWAVWNVNEVDSRTLTMYCQGIGKCDMLWSFPQDGTCLVKVEDGDNSYSHEYQVEQNLLNIALENAENRPVKLKIVRL